MLAHELIPRAESSYYPAPYSIDPLPEELRRGLIPIGIFALLSVTSTLALLGWITYRLISWRKHYRSYVGYNQYVLLIYNLLLADLQQSLSFLISFHWINQNKMLAPTSACFGQAWLVQIGDISSGMFVLAIALHTFFSVVMGRQVPFRTFLAITIGIWGAALGLTILGPALHGERYFTSAGAWCWVSDRYEKERLWLHYIWIFTIEFGTVIIYALIFVYLRRQLSNILSTSHSSTPNKVSQAARYMVVYPVTYVLLTLPLAAGRMASMTGRTLPIVYYSVAGTMMTSCGWVDAVLYTLTRRVLVSNELDPRKASSGRGNHSSGWEITSFDNRGGMGGDRSVTITGGNGVRGSVAAKGGVHVSATERGRSKSKGTTHFPSTSPSLREPSPHGSTDTIFKSDMALLGGVRAETKVEVKVERAENFLSSESSSDKTVAAPGGRRHSNPKGPGLDFD